MESPGASAAPRSTDNGRATHIFTELRSHDDLLLPVRGSKRLKYTCITCSRQYIALGSSHGGLYIFQRDTLKYLQQIGNKEGLTKALFSPNENIVGMATSGGAIVVWKLNVTSRQKAERVATTQTHRNRQITSLCWDEVGLRLFSGDERGRITVTNTDSSKPSGIFKFQSELVVDVDSSVIQMDFVDERLLVSTMTRCYLCDPKKRLSFQIGSKLRDGSYGACFLKKSGSEKPSIFCARPGSRMWEANTVCQVLNTHQFKQLLATPPLPVMGKGREVTFPAEGTKHPAQSLAFPILHPLGNHFLVTWNERGVYVFDPVNVNVVFWTSDISGLVDVSVSKSSLYCLHQDNHIRKYTLQNIARCASSLYQQSLLIQCSRLVLHFQTQFQLSRARHHMPPRVLHELAKRVATEDSILGCDVEELAVSAENRVLDVPSAVSSRRSSFDSYDGMRLQSGIYVVRKRLDSECSDDMPLGCDAHMDHMQGNMEWTEKSRQETIQEASSIEVDKGSNEATPTEETSLEVGVSFHEEDLSVDPKGETLLQEKSSGEISMVETGSRDIVVQQNNHCASKGYGLEEGMNELDEHVAESLGVAGEESSVGTDETGSPEGNNSAKRSVTDAQRPLGNRLQVEIDILLGNESEESSTAKQDSNLKDSYNITHTDQNVTEDIDETSKDEPLEQKKALKDRDSVIYKSEYEGGKQRLSGESSLKNDVISTPNQDAFKRSEDHTQEIPVKKDEKIGQVIADGFADIQSCHQSGHTVMPNLISWQQNCDELPLQEVGTTADITVNVEVPVSSPDECGQSLSSESPGRDLVEVEGTVQDELMIVEMGSDSLPMKLVAKDSHAPLERHSSPTAECELMGITEINQRKPSLTTLEKNPCMDSNVINTSVLQLDVSGIMTNTEVALQDMQSLKSVDEKGGNTHHKITRREVEERAQNLGNQRFTNSTATGDAVETKELFSGENIAMLRDLCLIEGKEKEANVQTSGEGSPIQGQEVIKQTAGEESHYAQDHEILIKEENMEVPKRSVNSMMASDESNLIDVSGFGISASEKSFHHPIQAEKVGLFYQSANANLSASRDRPHKGVHLAILAKSLHESSSGNESDLSSALRNEDKVMAMIGGQDVDGTGSIIIEERREGGDTWKQEDGKVFVSDNSSINEAIDQDIPKSINSLESGNSSNLAELVDKHEEGYSSPPTSNSSSNNSTMNDRVISLCLDKSTESPSESSSGNSDAARVNRSLPFKQNTSNASSSSENLEIVREDELEVAEENAHFPDAETQLIQSVTGSQYVQRETKLRERSLSLEKIIQELSGGNTSAPSASVKRKKTKSRVIDITATVSSNPSPNQSLAPGSVLYRPTSLPDLSPQSLSQPCPLQRTPSSTVPSPVLSPKKEVGRPSPVSSALPSPNLIIAATSGLPHSAGLMETQQIILSSTAQINLKSVKESLTSKFSKTKTFLQSIGDSNPLSPKEGEHDVPPMQPRPSPSSSPTHRKGVFPSVAYRGIHKQHSTGRPHPSPVSPPVQRACPTDEMEFPHELEKETPIDSRLSEELIETTKSAVPSLRNPHTHYSTNALRSVLQPWVHKLEQTYTSRQAEGIIPWSNGHLLPLTVREDVVRLAMMCLRLDIYADEEEVDGSNGEEREQGPGSEFQQGEKCNDFSRLDECRAAFIKRHFNILDRQGVLEILQYKQGCHHRTMEMLLQCERDAAWNSKISEALDNGDVQEAFHLLFRADLTSNNLPLSLCFLQSLCGLDSGRALDVMISDYPTIGPWHVYHILQDQTQSKCLILNYVESFLMTHPFAQRREFLEQVMSMEPLVVNLAEAAVTFDTPSSLDLFCDCGELPKLGSHLIKWSHGQILDLLLNSTSVPVDVLLPLFLRAGYWHGAIVLMARARDQKMDALKLCIQIGDIALISNNTGNFIPSNEKEWRTALVWMKKCQPSVRGKNDSSERKCLNCGATLAVCNITWSLTSEAMVVEARKQETEETVQDLSPSSQPECDWSIMEPSQPKDQLGNLSDKAAPSKGTDISEEIQCDRENDDMGNSQSYREDGSEDFVASEQSGLENPDASSSPSLLNDSDWLPSVTWQRIALLLVSRLGALKGVKLLREVQVPEGMLSRDFHQMCIYVSMWEKTQRLLSHALLEGTDTYLWSKRQPLLGPLLQHTIMKEHQGIIEGCVGTGSEGQRVLKAQKLLSQDKRYIEDPGTHWGRTTNLGRMCPVCHQSVAWSPALQSASCIIFPCGHVFHTHCIPEKACSLCFYGNQEMKL